MELDPKFVDVIVKRWEDFTGNFDWFPIEGQGSWCALDRDGHGAHAATPSLQMRYVRSWPVIFSEVILVTFNC
jgi:capsid protein